MTDLDTQHLTQPLTVSKLIEILKKLDNLEAEVFLNGMNDFYLFATKRHQDTPMNFNNTAYVFSDTSEPFWDDELEIPPDNLLVSLHAKTE